MAPSYILAIDQGTTSTRAVIYDVKGESRGSFAQELTQHYPRPGWVEHDPEDIWQAVNVVVPKALQAAKINPAEVLAIGVTNQRETSLLWERKDGKPASRALVWQDRRTADFCRQHHSDEAWLTAETGLVLDPYFSGTKLRWLLDNSADLQKRAENGQLAWGTIDSFLIWRLTGGKVHATDVTNASRTLLLKLETAAWDAELCRYFSAPMCLLPEVRPSAADYGRTSGLGFLPDGIPICGVAGDQQAALFGQCAFAPGEAKCTYGTGAFFLQHTGFKPILSRNRLLTTLAATIDQRPQYALEGSVFIAGAAVQWLRDGLKLFDQSSAVELLAAQSTGADNVVFVPALVGLGAPHWVPEAQGVIFGLTRGTHAADLARATLEGVAFQVADLIQASEGDASVPLQTLRVDGGMARNARFLQFQSDILGIPVLQAAQSESTALGAAYLAGLRAGLWPNLDSLSRLASQGRRFEPQMPVEHRQRRLALWRRAVQAVIAFYAPAKG